MHGESTHKRRRGGEEEGRGGQGKGAQGATRPAARSSSTHGAAPKRQACSILSIGRCSACLRQIHIKVTWPSAGNTYGHAGVGMAAEPDARAAACSMRRLRSPPTRRDPVDPSTTVCCIRRQPPSTSRRKHRRTRASHVMRAPTSSCKSKLRMLGKGSSATPDEQAMRRSAYSICKRRRTFGRGDPSRRTCPSLLAYLPPCLSAHGTSLLP